MDMNLKKIGIGVIGVRSFGNAHIGGIKASDCGLLCNC